MLLAVAICSLALAAAVAAHWAVTRVDVLGRRRPFPAVRVGLLIVLAGALAVPALRTARLEHLLSGVASELAGRSVSVDCRSVGAELVHAGVDAGRVDFGADGRPADVAVLGREICADLRRWRRGLGGTDPEPDVDGAVAVHVLVHESMHLAGERDEGRTECAAVQRDALAARLLGASDAEAGRLARTYWLVVYPTMVEPYRTNACTAGGGLDEGLPDAPWATAEQAS